MTTSTENAIKRHVADLMRLAAPVIVARAGLITMAIVDTVMVGRFSVQELAYLSIGLAPVITLIVAMTGLVMGTLVVTAAAYGAGRPLQCGATWRRSLPFALAIGGVGALICALGQPLLTALGQSPDLAAAGGRVALVIGLGLPAAIIFVTSSFFLEGIKRPLPGMAMMIAANILNVVLNWILIYGHLGFAPLGALGSAWATTGVRIFLAIGLVTYITCVMPERNAYGVWRPAGGGWRSWRRQRRIGYAAGASLGVEAGAFSVLSIFAGWLGPLALGAYSIVLNLIAFAFMVAIGFGSATAVRVGIAHGRGDHAGAARAGWSGLVVNTLAMGAFALIMAIFPAALVAVYSQDPALAALTVPAVAVAAWVLMADGGQAVMANALRGRGETWITTACHVFSYLVVMVPLSWFLALPAGRGVIGLLEGIFIASILSLVLLGGRFHWLAMRDKRTLSV
jgi:multidrug resistance protein, MATE family